MAKQVAVYDTATGKVEGVAGTTNQVLVRNSSGEWAAAGNPYDVSGEYPGALPTGATEELFHFIAVRPFTIKASGTNPSAGYAKTPPSGGSVTLTITKKPQGGGADEPVGTIVFADGANVPAFTIFADKSFVFGDRIVITSAANVYGIETVYWTFFAVVSA